MRKLITILLIFTLIIPTTIFGKTTKPSKVKGLKVSYVNNAVNIKYKKAKYATKYKIYMSYYKSKDFKCIKTTKKTIAKFKIVKKGTFYFKVRAINKNKKGKFSKTRGLKILSNNRSILPVIPSITPKLKNDENTTTSLNNEESSFNIEETTTQNTETTQPEPTTIEQNTTTIPETTTVTPISTAEPETTTQIQTSTKSEQETTQEQTTSIQQEATTSSYGREPHYYKSLEDAITDLNEESYSKALNIDGPEIDEAKICLGEYYNDTIIAYIMKDTTINNTLTIRRPLTLRIGDDVTLTNNGGRVQSYENFNIIGGKLNIIAPTNTSFDGPPRAFSTMKELELHDVDITQNIDNGPNCAFECLGRFIIHGIKFVSKGNNNHTNGCFLIATYYTQVDRVDNIIYNSSFECEDINLNSFIWYLGRQNKSNITPEFYLLNNTFKANKITSGGIVWLGASGPLNYLIEENTFVIKNCEMCLGVADGGDANVDCDGYVTNNKFYINKNDGIAVIFDYEDEIKIHKQYNKFFTSGNSVYSYEDYKGE